MCADAYGPANILQCMIDLKPLLGEDTEDFVEFFVMEQARQMPALVKALAIAYLSSRLPEEDSEDEELDDAEDADAEDADAEAEEEEEAERPIKQSSSAYKKVWRTRQDDGYCEEFVVTNLAHLLGGIGLTRFNSDHKLSDGPAQLILKLNNSTVMVGMFLNYAKNNLARGTYPKTREALIDVLAERVFVQHA